MNPQAMTQYNPYNYGGQGCATNSSTGMIQVVGLLFLYLLLNNSMGALRTKSQGAIDKLGAFDNAFRAAWNLQFPGNPVLVATWADYDPKLYA